MRNNRYISFYLRIFLLTISSIVIFIPSTFAAKLTAEVDRNKIAINEEVQLSIIATGGKMKDPEMTTTNDLDISFAGTSSNMQIINGTVTSSETYNYRVVPKRMGRIVIPDVTAEIDGQKYSTNPIVIEVGKADEKTNADRQDLVFVTAQVDNLKPYLNQQIMYTFRFFRKVQTGTNQLKYPDFKDFWTEDAGKQTEYDKTINGERYIVSEVKKALYPTKTGNVEIPSTIFNVELIYKESDDSFGGIFEQTRSEPKSFVTNKIKLNVRPIPGNKPSSFSNLVATDMSLRTTVSNKNVKAGEPVTLTAVLRGAGNINDIRKLPLNIKDAKIYEDKPSSKSFLEGEKLITEKTFKYTIIPLKENKLNIPAINLSYLNPVSSTFQNVKSSSENLSVGKSDDPNFVQNTQTEQTKDETKSEENKDIFDIHTNDTMENKEASPYKFIVYLIWFLIPIAVYLLTSGRKIKFKKENKSGKGYKEIINRINNLETNLSDKDFSKKVSDILQAYLAKKFSLSETNTFAEIKSTDKIPETYISQLNKLIQEYDFMRFSGSNNNDKNKEILQSTKSLINKLEEIK